MTTELTEGRVLLREFVDGDVDALLAIHADPRLLRYYPVLYRVVSSDAAVSG